MAFISNKVAILREEIADLCGKAGRKIDNVTIVAVTKNVEVSLINEAINGGITDIGENRLQEAKKQFEVGLLPCAKHFIGHLQSNKVKDAVKLFDTIDSLDSYGLAELINVEAERVLKKMPVLAQVNIAEDKAKYGLSADEAPHFLRKISIFKWLDVQGLMAIIPYFKNPEDGRKYFKAMKKLFDELSGVYHGFKRLSMGMSNDFRVALEEGATEVRLGTYLFK